MQLESPFPAVLICLLHLTATVEGMISACARLSEYGEVRLDCSRRGLHRFMHANISLDGVDILDWSHNNVTEIKSIGQNYADVGKVYLSHNQISIVEWAYLAAAFPRIYMLDLSNNLIMDVNISVEFRVTNRLNLAHNTITKVQAKSLIGLKRLEHLDLSHNRIIVIEPKGLFGLPKLKILKLAHNRLLFWPSEIFSCGTRLSDLDLSANHLMDIEEGALDNSTSPNYFHFDVSDNKIRFVDLDIFTPIKRGMVTLNDNFLTNLSFSGSTLTCQDQQVVFNFQRNKFYTLPDLTYFIECQMSLLNMMDNPIYCGCVGQHQDFISLGCRMVSTCVSNERTSLKCDEKSARLIWNVWYQKNTCSSPKVTRLQKDQQKKYQGFCIADGNPTPSFTMVKKYANRNETLNFTLLPSMKEIIFNLSLGEFTCMAESPFGFSSRSLAIESMSGISEESTHLKPHNVALAASLTILLFVVLACVVGFFLMRHYFTKRTQGGYDVQGAMSKRLSNFLYPKAQSPDMNENETATSTLLRKSGKSDVVPQQRPATSMF